jgi:hypothetical protein
MNKRSPWYDANTETSRLLAALEQPAAFCNSSELLSCARKQHSYVLLQAIKEAIDDYAQCEMGHREYFWGRPRSAVASTHEATRAGGAALSLRVFRSAHNLLMLLPPGNSTFVPFSGTAHFHFSSVSRS